jgi:hypothetical protein
MGGVSGGGGDAEPLARSGSGLGLEGSTTTAGLATGLSTNEYRFILAGTFGAAGGIAVCSFGELEGYCRG